MTINSRFGLEDKYEGILLSFLTL